MSSILQIIQLSIRELLAKKTLYALLFIMFMILGAVGSPLYDLITEASNGQNRLAEKAEILGKIIGMWSHFTVYFVMGFSAYSIHSQIKSKSIVGVLAKPVSRTEFLLGRWLGVVIFFSAILLIGIIFILALMYLWGISVDFLVFTGIVYRVAVLVVYSVIAFVLSLFLPTLIGGGIAFLLFIFRKVLVVLVNSSNPVLEAVGYLLFYSTPAPMHENIVNASIVNNLLDPKFEMYWGIIFENFVLAGLLLFAGVLLYQYKDITLD